MAKVALIRAEVLEGLRRLSAESVHCCITSPPYWGLRDYGVPAQLGLEKTPEEYIEKMVAVFREVRRVMRKDATLWLNLGDSYAGSWGDSGHRPDRTGFPGHQREKNTETFKREGHPQVNKPVTVAPPGLKPKDLCGIPWRLALALQADGWWLRSDIIWHKPNPMPESVTDRPTTSHEHIFLLTKASKYFYDAEAVRENGTIESVKRLERQDLRQKNGYVEAHFGNPPIRERRAKLVNRERESHEGFNERWQGGATRNLRSVWTLATEPFPEAHFATFPTSIPERCIKAGTSEKGCCPKCGAGWRRVMEKSKTFQSGSGKSGNPISGKNGPNCQGGGDTGDIRKGPCLSTATIGFRLACKCPHTEADLIPATVLDPFSGAATTLMVAAKLGRDAIGIELNPAYVEMSVKRLKKELGMLMDLEVK